MKKRIDLLLQDDAKGSYPLTMAKRVKAQLEKEGIEVVVLSLSSGQLGSYLSYAMKEPPQALITFEEYFSKELSLSKLLGCPEFFIAQNALTPIADLLEKKIMALPCRKLARYAQGQFFSHPFIEESKRLDHPRTIQIALFEDMISLDALKKIWDRYFSKEVARQLIDWCAQNPHLHPLQQMFSLPDEAKRINGHDLYSALTNYLQASRIRPLVEAFYDLPLHIFGDHVGGDIYCTLSNAESVHLHSLPPYGYIPDLLEEIEIIVFDQMAFIDGPPEHFFMALQKGVLPLTAPSKYLTEIFGKASPIFYRNHAELRQKCLFFTKKFKDRHMLVEKCREASIFGECNVSKLLR